MDNHKQIQYNLYNVELTHKINVGNFEIEPLEDYDSRLRELKKYSSQNFSIETVKATTISEISEKAADDQISKINSLISFAQGRAITFSNKIILKNGELINSINSLTIFGRSTGMEIIWPYERESFLKKGYETLLNKNNDKSIGGALYWYNLAFWNSTSIQDDFLKRWIAFELLVESYRAKKNIPKKIIPKNKFPLEDLIAAIQPILVNHKYSLQQQKVVNRQVTTHLNTRPFLDKAFEFLDSKEINLPYLTKKNKTKIQSLYTTRNNLIHSGFGSKTGTKESTHSALLEKLIQRVLLAKLNFRNDYFYGDFWGNPFVKAVGKPNKSVTKIQ